MPYCLNCGNHITTDATFCNNCGRKVTIVKANIDASSHSTISVANYQNHNFSQKNNSWRIVFVISSVVLLVVCAILLVLFLSTNGKLKSANNSLNIAQNQITTLQSTNDSLNSELASTTKQFGDTTIQLQNTQGELETTKTTLNTSISQVNTLTTQLSATQTQLSNVQSQLSDTQSKLDNSLQQLSYAQSTLSGLGITVHAPTSVWTLNNQQWNHTNNPSAVNTTWSNLSSFITQDTTDRHVYNINTYNCVNYAVDIYNHAETAGINTARVSIYFKGESVGHALNAFITSDYGMVFIDCMEHDNVAHVSLGETYKSVNLRTVPPSMFRNNTWWNAQQYDYYYIPTSSGQEAVVTSIDIWW
jgi:hypothetical protein